MNGKGVLLQGVLAAVGLGAVYTTWQREPDRAPGETTVVNLGKKDLKNVHYEDDLTSVDLFQQGETPDGDPDVWLKITERKPPAPKPAGATADTKEPAPGPAPVTKELRGGESARRVWAEFTPLHSPRAFGVLDAAKSKELGVDDAAAKKKMSLTGGGQTFSFVLGQPPAQGGGETYMRGVKDGQVFLIKRQLLSDLQAASHRLVDRRILPFKLGDFDRLSVTARGKTRPLVIVNRHDVISVKLAPASAPDKPDDMLKTWHEKIWRLSPAEVLGKGEQPPEGEPKVDVRIEYFDRNKPMGWLELAHAEKPADNLASSSTKPAAPTTVQFARSSHTAGWVRLPSDPVLIPDSEKVAAGG